MKIRFSRRLLGATILAAAAFAMQTRAASPRIRDSFDAGWRFARFGPMPDKSTKEEPKGLEKPGCDDSAWRKLDLPHDWGIEGPFRQDLDGNTGKLPWQGIGWHRKSFVAPAGDKGKRIFLDFDGAMANSKVFPNGEYVGGWPYGYTITVTNTGARETARFDLTIARLPESVCVWNASDTPPSEAPIRFCRVKKVADDKQSWRKPPACRQTYPKNHGQQARGLRHLFETILFMELDRYG